MYNTERWRVRNAICVCIFDAQRTKREVVKNRDVQIGSVRTSNRDACKQLATAAHRRAKRSVHARLMGQEGCSAEDH